MLGQPGFELIAAVDALAADLEKRAAAPEATELVQIARRPAATMRFNNGGVAARGSSVMG